MQTIRQKVRPKHQVLILKCYPRLSKNSAAAEVKPNGSELSYLLYYASSRRSKLSKVGTFLEHRNANDLHKSRTTSIQITLLILTAFLNNPAIGGAGPAGFDLFAPFVLRILRDILQRPTETVLVEDALATWAVFCTRQDHVLLSADAEYRELFTAIVKLWAAYAKKSVPEDRKRAGLLRHGKVGHGVGDAIRLRTAALQALKSLSDSDTLGPEAGQQLEILIPVLCHTLEGHESNLTSLLEQLQRNEAQERDKVTRGRPSMAPSRHTTESVDPRAAEGTAADADRLADQEADIIALQCLRSICMVENRLQIRAATLNTLAHITNANTQQPSSQGLEHHETWSLKLFETMCRWIPVQDRFVALFCAVQTLVAGVGRSKDDLHNDIARHLLLSRLVAHVLGSDINFIGLSVMDIMLGLLQSLLRVARIHHDVSASPTSNVAMANDNQLLLARLRKCVTNLAVHVYYTDQISDMVSALLAATSNEVPTAATSLLSPERDSPTDDPTDESLKTRTNSNSNSPGGTEFARQVALDAVRDVITVANAGAAQSSYVADNRNSVPVNVWDGTDWLLRDQSLVVRQSYVGALISWLTLELRKADSIPEEPEVVFSLRKTKSDASETPTRSGTLNKTSVNAKFLQSLHVAIFDNVVQLFGLSGADRDALLLHALLFALAKSLGFNAVRISLPMVLAVQDNLSTMTLDGAVRAGDLVFGYLLSLCHIFGLNRPSILAEIEKRKTLGLWIDKLEVPPLPVEQIPSAPAAVSAESAPPSTDALTPFNDREAFIKQLITSHVVRPTHSRSPSQSVPTTQALPVLNVEAILASQTPNRRKSNDTDQLPQYIKEDLSSPWSREMALSMLSSDLRNGSFSSFNGLASSGRGTGAGARSRPASTVFKDYLVANWDHRQLLAAANTTPNVRLRPNSRDSSPRAGTFGGAEGASMASKHRSTSRTSRIITNQSRFSQSPERSMSGRLSGGSNSPAVPRYSADSRASTAAAPVRVEDLKRVLATGDGPAVTADFYDDSGSESMLDVDESFGEFDLDDDVGHGNHAGDELAREQVANQDFALEGNNHNDDDNQNAEDNTNGETKGYKTPPEIADQMHVRKTRDVETEQQSPKDTQATGSQWADLGAQLPAATPSQNRLTANSGKAASLKLAARASADGMRLSSRLSAATSAGDYDHRLSRASSQGNMSARRHISGASSTTHRRRTPMGGAGGSIAGSGRGTMTGGGFGASSLHHHRRHMFSGGHDPSSAAASVVSSSRSSSANLAHLLASVNVDDDGDVGAAGAAGTAGTGTGTGASALGGADGAADAHWGAEKHSVPAAVGLEDLKPPY